MEVMERGTWSMVSDNLPRKII